MDVHFWCILHSIAGDTMVILSSTDGEKNLPTYFAQSFGVIKKLNNGRLDVKLEDGRVFRAQGLLEGPEAEFTVHNDDLFARLIREGDLGFSDAYLDGWWTTPDLQAFMDLMHAENDEVYEGFPGMALVRLYERTRFWLQSNSKKQAKKNISYHYDLGNDFYSLWLDKSMTYSSAYFKKDSETLEKAQENKYASIIDQLGVKPGCTINAETCNRRREMVDAAMEMGCELIPHNFEQGELLTTFYNNPKKEEELIQRTLEVFEKTTRTKPQGWLSSSLRGTLNTAEILVKNGLKFYCDTMNDDQPYMIATPSGEITAVPYSNEINDFTLLTRRGHTTDEFRDILLEEMSVLYAESSTTAKIMNVGLHPHVSGRAYRIRAIKEFIQAAQKLPGVWWATRADLTEWYAQCQQEHIPRPSG